MEPQNDTSPGISLQDLLQILKRRRTVLVQSFVGIATISVVVTLLTRPVYEARARLLVEAPSANVNTVDVSNPVSELLALTQPQSVATQVEVLQSPTLIKQVSRETATPPAGFKVEQVEDTNVIEATVESPDAAGAAAAANRWLSDYIAQDIDRNLTEVRKAEEFAVQHGADAQHQLDVTENQLAAFKMRHHVSDLVTERQKQIEHVANLQATYEQQVQSLAAIQMQIEANDRLLASQPADIMATSKTTNQDISTLNQKLADLKVQRASLLQPGQFTPEAPEVKLIDGQIKALQQQLKSLPAMTSTETATPNPARDTIKSKLLDLRSQEAGATAQAAKIRQDLQAAKSLVGNYAAWEVKLAQLLREYDEASAQYKMFQDKVADLSLREQAHHSSATVIEHAVKATHPVRPKRILNIAIGCLIGLFLGVCLALLQEYLDDRIHSVDEADRLLGLSSLGFVPSLSAADAKLLTRMSVHDPAAESYRVLRTNIQFASIDMPAHTMLVTSTNPGEGKTTTATNLAFAMAMDGRRVILVDTDLRRPSIHNLLNIESRPGLTDVLLGQKTLEQALQRDDLVPNLMMLTAGAAPPNPSELLNSRRFVGVVDQLKEHADVVIFDSPPVLVAADAAILASRLDGVVLVVETGGTKKEAARRAVQLLRQAHAKLLGVAHNRVSSDEGGYYYQYRYQYSYSKQPEQAEIGGNGRAPQLDAPANETKIGTKKR